ncbi:Hypothetical protein SRAE_0000057700 [Strongyloides ratti]|uniref:C2H2-type domain-containing protein n=1 Tax=Strongyloides ratti TaxID=34506 RepID=A0A090MT10_STRRB|nr:Hypothetical protein SRAE_0000057700 [Strongyloides ratti]CEF61453.1 Hypothetical protein SRAE_0000057700 [Strongyloides ratti]
MDDSMEKVKFIQKNCLYCGVLTFFDEQMLKNFYINNCESFFYVCDNCKKSSIENIDNISDKKENEQISFQNEVREKFQAINDPVTNYVHYTNDIVTNQHLCPNSRAYNKLRYTFINKLIHLDLSIQEIKLFLMVKENEEKKELFNKHLIMKTRIRKCLEECNVEETIQIENSTKCIFKAMLKQILSHTTKIKKMTGEYRLDIEKLSTETYKKVYKFTSECKICNFDCITPQKMIEHVFSFHLGIKNSALLKCATCIKHFSFSESFLDFYTVFQHYVTCNQHNGEKFKNNFIQASRGHEISIYIDECYGYDILIDYEKTFDLCFVISEFTTIYD